MPDLSDPSSNESDSPTHTRARIARRVQARTVNGMVDEAPGMAGLRERPHRAAAVEADQAAWA